MPPSDEGGGFLRSKKTEGEKKLPLSRLPPTAPLTRGAKRVIGTNCRPYKAPLPKGGW